MHAAGDIKNASNHPLKREKSQNLIIELILILKDTGKRRCGNQVTANYSPSNRYAEPQDVLAGLAECNDVLKLVKPFKAMAAGAAQYYLLKYDGTMLAWGENENGELGDGTSTARDQPAPLSLTNVSNIIATFNSLGVTRIFIQKNDGSVWAWGDNDRFFLSRGLRYQRTSVMIPGLSNVKEIVDAFSHMLAFKNDGTVWTWGNNHNGALGDGTTTSRDAPGQVGGLTDVIAVAGRSGTSYAVKRDGSVWRWGMAMVNDQPVSVTNPVQVPGLQSIRSVWIAPNYYGPHFALNSEGTAISWWESGSSESQEPMKVLLAAEAPFKNNKKLFGIAGGPLALNADGKIYAIQYRYGEYVTYVYLPLFTDVADIYGGSAARTEVSNYFFIKKDGSLWTMTDSGGLPTAVDL